jgi:uncharacterized protein (DUF885 family)
VRLRLALIFAAPLAGISSSGAQQAQLAGFPALANEFVFTTLSFSPANATQTGLHQYRDPGTGRALELDQMLDDLSPAGMARQRAFYTDFRRRLEKLPVSRMDPQTQADYGILQNAVSAAFFSMDRERFLEWKPQIYPELLGSALFANISLEYADRNTRARDLAARLKKVPAFVDQAIGNLKASNDVFRRVALESMDGVRDLVRTTGAEFVKGTPSEQRYRRAQSAALTSLDRFDAFVKNTLPQKPQRDWRMGRANFAEKSKYYLEVSGTPEQLLRAAEDSLRVIRAEMLRLAEPLHSQWFRGHRHAASDREAYTNSIVSEVMQQIGREHANRDALVAQAKKDVAMLEKMVVDRRVLSLDDFSNLRVIPTPPFMRGIYGVAGAVFAPALQPKLSTFYWVTPIPDEWPAERAESKMREYNKYQMLRLTMHEAMPGHAVQGAYANRVTPEWRRLLRSVYGNTPYVEGWAVYAESVMERAGANGGNAAKMRLNGLKWMARIYMNSILDVKLHTQNMNGDSAVALMIRDAFQERPEAEAKLQRAQLDYVQLMTYAAGVQEWNALRRDVEKKEGSAFNMCRYHDTVLLYGAVSVPTVRKLYMAGVKPDANAPPSRCGK